MLQRIFKAVISKVPSDVQIDHPLHVGVNKMYISLVAQENLQLDENGFIAALMKGYPVLYDPFECFFVQIQIVETPAVLNEDEIPVYVSEEFISHYNFIYGEVCYLKSVLCHTLEKIVLGAKTTGSYAWFRDFKDLKRHNDLVVACCNKRFLCRQDDVLLVDPSKHSSKVFSYKDYIILDCQPFRQGIITLNSSLTVADLRDSTFAKDKDGKSLIDTADSMTFGTYALSLINYTSSNFLGIRLPNTTVTPSYAPLNALKFLCSFEIRVISKLNIHFQKEIVKVNKDMDPLNTVFVSCGIAKKLHLIDGSWVKINIMEPIKTKARSPADPLIGQFRGKVSDGNIQNLIRFAQVCCFSDQNASSHYFPNDKIVYMSPHLWFNLNKQPSLLIQPQLRLQIEPLDVGSSPPIAAEAHATLIQSPNYDERINSQAMLSEYFSTPRLIRKGDILSIDSKDQFDFNTKMPDDDHDKLKWPVVYFRIASIEGEPSPHGYVMSKKTTRLYQLGIKQSYVPLTMEAYYSSFRVHPVWESIPEGLSHYISLLQDLILPFLKLQNEKCHLSANILFSGPPCCGKATVVKAVCRSLNLHLFQVNCHELVGEISAVVEARLKNKIDRGVAFAPCVILLKNIHLIGKEREASEDSRVINTLANLLKNVNSYGSAWPVVVIGTTTERKLNSDLVSSFLHTVQMDAPTEEERSLLLQDLLTVCDVGSDVSTRFLAQRTAGFVLGDLCALVNQAIRNTYSRIRKFVNTNGLNPKEEEDIIFASVPVVQKDLINALENLQSKFAEAIGAPKIPNVKFEDIGGLAHVKQEILDTIQLPLEHPEILISGLRRSGVLLYGPPGSGKTMLAKAVATECSLNFLSVKGPELINMYVGQSEENVRAVFAQARSAVPCIIFFDELDSLAPNRGRSGDSGGVMDRVVSQLLSELDGLNKKSEVFVIGATNRPDLLDPALLRPGRFDRLLYVGIPEDKKSKLNILKALTRKIPLAIDVNLEDIIDSCPPHLSGADFYSLCSNAVIQRVEKNVSLLEKGEKTIEELNSDVRTEDFLSAMKTLVPSVSPDQFEQYKSIKSKIEKE
ncbi:unnamed protein product [Larinioides sclopetarius]|uniref:Peroxisomal ATPase PEX6 n=2 Tax=Larinioides sclopetarius TaxID=280406 RepID=A0AAV2B2W8_9ARAC